MVLIKLKFPMSGTRNGAEWPPVGQPFDVSDDEAADLIRNGVALEVEPEVRTATAPTSGIRTATKR